MVTDGVDTVRQAVEDFDLEKYVQHRPLASVGIAMLGGFVLGAMLGGDEDRNRHSYSYQNGSSSESYSNSSSGSSGPGIGHTLRNAVQKSGLEDTISNAGAALMGTFTEQVKDMVDRSFPGFSDKLSNAQQQSGSFAEKASAAQEEAQQN